MMSSRSQLRPQNQWLISGTSIGTKRRCHLRPSKASCCPLCIEVNPSPQHTLTFQVKLRHKKRVCAKVSTPKFAGSWRQKHWYEASILPTIVTFTFFCIQHPITRRHTFSILGLTLVQGAMVDNVRFKCALSRTFADFLAKVAFSCEPEPPPVGLKPVNLNLPQQNAKGNTEHTCPKIVWDAYVMWPAKSNVMRISSWLKMFVAHWSLLIPKPILKSQI